MKHRHKLAQTQRHKSASRTTRDEIDEAADEQLLPGKTKPKKPGGSIHAARARHHLGKRGRIGQRPRHFDDGGAAGSASTRSPNDPGGELDAANRARKSTLGWIKDEIMGGTRPAYKHGGRQRPRKYDAGGAAPPGGGISNLPPAPSGADFIATPQKNPVVAFVQRNIPPMSRLLQNPKLIGAGVQAGAGLKGIPPIKGIPGISGNKQGGRVHKNRGKENN